MKNMIHFGCQSFVTKVANNKVANKKILLLVANNKVANNKMAEYKTIKTF